MNFCSCQSATTPIPLTCKLKWDFDYNSSCFYRAGIVKRTCYNKKSHFSLHVKAKQQRNIMSFHNIKSNWTMSRSDWKCFPVHKYWLNQSKLTFSMSITEGACYFFPGRVNGLPSVDVVAADVDMERNWKHWVTQDRLTYMGWLNNWYYDIGVLSLTQIWTQ